MSTNKKQQRKMEKARRKQEAQEQLHIPLLSLSQCKEILEYPDHLEESDLKKVYARLSECTKLSLIGRPAEELKYNAYFDNFKKNLGLPTALLAKNATAICRQISKGSTVQVPYLALLNQRKFP